MLQPQLSPIEVYLAAYTRDHLWSASFALLAIKTRISPYSYIDSTLLMIRPPLTILQLGNEKWISQPEIRNANSSKGQL